MPSHYDDKKKSRFRGLKPGEELTTAGPGIEAIKTAVKKTGTTLFGGIAPEKRGGFRGREIGERAGTGFMESGIPIPVDQSGVRQPMPARPAVGDMGDPTQILPVVTGGGVPRGAIPAGPVDLTPRLGEIEAGVEGALPAAFDTGKAHELGLERYQEGQVYLPPGQRGRYADIMDKVLGPAPTPPEGIARPVTQGIPSEITPPTSSGNAMVDLFRFVSHNKRVQERNKIISEQQRRGIDVEKFEKGQEFKERKLESEEKGREGALDLSRRKAIATTAKEADKLDPFKKRALDLLQKDPEYPFLQGEEKRTAELRAIEEVEKRHGRTSGKKKPTIEAFINAAKEQGSKMSQKSLETEFKKRYGA